MAHSTAHHAVSGLCHVVPHLKKACLRKNEYRCIINLLGDYPGPDPFRKNRPLQSGLEALKEKFMHILIAEGFEPDDLSEAILEYEFPMVGDDYTSNCCVTIVTQDGKRTEKAVDYIGQPAKIRKTNTEQEH